MNFIINNLDIKHLMTLQVQLNNQNNMSIIYCEEEYTKLGYGKTILSRKPISSISVSLATKKCKKQKAHMEIKHTLTTV